MPTDLPRRPVDDVPAVARFLGIPPRTAYHAFSEGGELAKYTLRVGPRRIKVLTERLLRDMGLIDQDTQDA